jgi:hypothetical protein
MGDKGGAAAAVAAITVKAKLADLLREKVAVTDPSGEKAPRYIISDRPMTEEEWARERWGLKRRVHLRSFHRQPELQDHASMHYHDEIRICSGLITNAIIRDDEGRVSRQ